MIFFDYIFVYIYKYMNSHKCEKCKECKEYYIYNGNLCSNCYIFKTTGKYKIHPINIIIKNLHDKYIDKNLINFFIKLVLSKLNIEYNDLYDIIINNDIYIKYEHAQTIYKLLKSDDKKKNMNLEHVLSFRIIDYWHNRLGGASCYYDGSRDKPKSLNEANNVIHANKEHFNYFQNRVEIPKNIKTKRING